MNIKATIMGALVAAALPMSAYAVTIAPPVTVGGTPANTVATIDNRTVSTFNFVNSPLVEGDSELITLTFTQADDSGPGLAIINFDVTDGSDLILTAIFDTNVNLLGDSTLALGEAGATTFAEVDQQTGGLNIASQRLTGGVPNGIPNDTGDPFIGTGDFDNASGFPPAEISFNGLVGGTGRSIYVVWDSYNPAVGTDGSLILQISAVPLPAGLVLMLTALGGLGFVSRFRGKTATA